MILHRYFARRFLRWFTIVTLSLSVVVAVTQIVELIPRFPNLPMTRLLYLGLLNTPQMIYSVTPLAIVLASAATFVGLSRSSELTVARAGTVSLPRALLGPAVATFGVGVLAVTIGNPIVAGTMRAFDTQTAALSGNVLSATTLGQDGLWLREGDGNGQTVIHGLDASPDGTDLRRVRVLQYGPDGALVARIDAASAALTDGVWTLRSVKRWDMTAGIPEKSATTAPTLELPSTLTPERIRDGFGDPLAVAFWDLPGFIQHMNAAGFQALRHKVWLHSEIARPAFWVAMLIMAASFCMKQHRAGGTGLMVMGAVIAGFLLYFLRRFAIILGDNGQLPVLVAAWTPVLASLMVAVALLLHQEDR